MVLAAVTMENVNNDVLSNKLDFRFELNRFCKGIEAFDWPCIFILFLTLRRLLWDVMSDN